MATSTPIEGKERTVRNALEFVVDDRALVLARVYDDAHHVLGGLALAEVETEAFLKADHRPFSLVRRELGGRHERGGVDDGLPVRTAREERLDGQLGELAEANRVAPAHEDDHLVRKFEGGWLEFDALAESKALVI